MIGADGKQIGVIQLNDALQMARAHGLDLVEIAPTAVPPVCRIVDFGKYRYEIAKRDKESKKHQHANKVKEVQLSPNISEHDFGVKKGHAIDFLCEDMKVKITLKFRGREMMHQEFGFQVVNKFLKELAPWGQPDFTPKLMGRGLNAMISPLPRSKRAKNPNEGQRPMPSELDVPDEEDQEEEERDEYEVNSPESQPGDNRPPRPVQPEKPNGFTNNPFANLNPALNA